MNDSMVNWDYSWDGIEAWSIKQRIIWRSLKYAKFKIVVFLLAPENFYDYPQDKTDRCQKELEIIEA